MAYIDDTGEVLSREETTILTTANQRLLMRTLGTSPCGQMTQLVETCISCAAALP